MLYAYMYTYIHAYIHTYYYMIQEAESTSLLLAPAKNNNQLLLSGKIVEDAIKSATSLFSIPKAIASRVQAAKLRLPITEIRSVSEWSSSYGVYILLHYLHVLYVCMYVCIKEVFLLLRCFRNLFPLCDRFGDVIDGEMDWSDGDFIFLSGYSFPDDLLSAVFDRARALKMGSKVVTLSLPEDKDKLYRKFHFFRNVFVIL